MDDYLRILHRRWLAQPDDIEAALVFLHALSRSGVLSERNGPQGPNPLEIVVIDLLLSHCDEHGVDTHTNTAMHTLLRSLYGQDVASLYLRFVDAVDNRWFFGQSYPGHPAVIDQFMVQTPIRCPHSENCDTNDAKCHVTGCLCPGCHVVAMIYDNTEIKAELCYHHNQIATTNVDQFWELFTLAPDL